MLKIIPYKEVIYSLKKLLSKYFIFCKYTLTPGIAVYMSLLLTFLTSMISF